MYLCYGYVTLFLSLLYANTSLCLPYILHLFCNANYCYVYLTLSHFFLALSLMCIYMSMQPIVLICYQTFSLLLCLTIVSESITFTTDCISGKYLTSLSHTNNIK